eukprot:CAMPEP_0194342786 /NCGR_PEP_ID=MMETSP0171-20130528/94084_1 /TAXON_ID=218684 /ORGANISM="Corethron pennatum, Strain L29A3" /LENGTH=72 /DNA_ID=CAMNT_0039108689 /DNA_START=29 /DNA_END=243 /DNA_ORIENTATION=-
MMLLDAETDDTTGEVIHKIIRSFDVDGVEEVAKLDESKIVVRFYKVVKSYIEETCKVCKVLDVETGDCLASL